MINRADPNKAFLGAGWSFPLRVEPGGALSLAAYEQDIQQAIRIILGTNPGERVMRPDFGAGLRAFVFEPVSPSTMHRLETRVREALTDWEPRIDVTEVRATADPPVRNKVLINIQYRVRASNSHANLVYPFYLQEGERR